MPLPLLGGELSGGSDDAAAIALLAFRNLPLLVSVTICTVRWPTAPGLLHAPFLALHTLQAVVFNVMVVGLIGAGGEEVEPRLSHSLPFTRSCARGSCGGLSNAGQYAFVPNFPPLRRYGRYGLGAVYVVIRPVGGPPNFLLGAVAPGGGAPELMLLGFGGGGGKKRFWDSN